MEPEQKISPNLKLPKHHVGILAIPNPVNFVQENTKPYERCPWDLTRMPRYWKLLQLTFAKENLGHGRQGTRCFSLDPQKNRGFLGFCCSLEATRNGGLFFFAQYLKICKDAMGGKSFQKKNTTARQPWSDCRMT